MAHHPHHGETWTGGERRGGERDRDRWDEWRESDRSMRGGEWRGRDEWRGYDRPRGGQRDADRSEVMEGGDRGWPGGVTGAEGGGGYGRSWFGEAYSLYAGRPEHEERGRWERMGHTAGERPKRPMARGPKGYRRSDERMHEDVCECIARSGVNAEAVEVRVENGEVTLSGTVNSREEKRFIEDLAEDIFGVRDVHNEIRVVRPGHSGERTDTH